VKALESTWHKECFDCSGCNLNFNVKGLGYHEFEGRAYCEPCYDQAALKSCKSCGEGVKDKVLKALGGYWHEACLICQECHSTFGDGKSLYSRDGLPLCGVCGDIE